tara:strand:- start:969 stop:2054 length:1086 start_codon:yes stop_codon:yes gene_type:complete
MTDIRQSLEHLANAIEAIDKKPPAAPVINDRSLSGNKIHGGIITKFASAGIRDDAKQVVLIIEDGRISVDNANIRTITSNLTVAGNLKVEGEVHARKLHVEEISADIRNERTSPLEFKETNGKEPLGKGLLWTGGKYTKQFVLQSNDRLWSSENIDLQQDRDYKIGNETVLGRDSLGTSVVNSNLRKVGVLDSLRVSGNLNVDEFFKYDANSQQLSLGAEEANGMLTLQSWDHQFIVDPTEDRQWKLGTWTTSALRIITDDTTRIEIGASGNISVKGKTSFERGVGIGVKNFTEDADLTVAGAVRFQDKKFEVASSIPENGSYKKGDIVWNNNPTPTGHVGWICVREGTPGAWKSFGQISS